jgi:hypothetical protein
LYKYHFFFKNDRFKERQRFACRRKKRMANNCKKEGEWRFVSRGGKCGAARNPRYSSFKQTFFTAGDEEQLFQRAVPHMPVTRDVWYQTLYVFNNFKKGVLVHIRDSQVALFLPFNKAAYVNPFTELLKVDPTEFTGFADMFAYVDTHTCKKVTSKDQIAPMCTWTVNGGLLRYDTRVVELDKGLAVLRAHLDAACAAHHIPDATFILNARDFPVVHAKQLHPHVEMFGHVPLKEGRAANTVVPVFSMSTSKVHSDIPFPTWEENECSSTSASQTPLASRKPMAVFRGTSTGLNTTGRNPRLRILELARQYPDKIDAGITHWNMRVRKCASDAYLRVIDSKWPKRFPAVPFMDYNEQAKYRMIINLPGHTVAFRLPTILGLGSVVLHVDDFRYKGWFETFLKPWVHYVPLRFDLGDLIEKIEWCLAHPDVCEYIVANATEFVRNLPSTRAKYIADILVQHAASIITDPKLLLRFATPFSPLAPYTFHVDNFKPSCRKKIQFHRQYVLKRIVSEEDVNELFVYNEAVRHVHKGFRHVYGIHFTGDPNTGMWLVMQRVEGQSLIQWLVRSRPQFAQIMGVLSHVNRLLARAYEQVGFAHNDCSPWNVLVTVRPDGLHPVVIDYGKSSARVFDHTGEERAVGLQFYSLGNNHDKNRDAYMLMVKTLYIAMQNGLVQKYACKNLLRVSLFPSPLAVFSCLRKFDAAASVCIDDIVDPAVFDTS